MYGFHGYLESIEASCLGQLHLLAESVGQVLHHYAVCTCNIISVNVTVMIRVSMRRRMSTGVRKNRCKKENNMSMRTNIILTYNDSDDDDGKAVTNLNVRARWVRKFF
jgi:hypothetical protein